MFKKLLNEVKETIKEEYKFIIFIVLLFIILNFPLNYYITVGGGISSAEDRINVEDKHESRGSFNISYVTQLDANILTYGMSYLIPTWERTSADLYKYDEEENLEDIAFRSELELTSANSTATYWAYTLAKKKIKEKDSRLYVIATQSKDYPTALKVKDEIVEMDGKHYDSIEGYTEVLQSKEVNSEIEVKIKRNNKEEIVKTKIYEKNNKKILGIYLQYIKEYETDPKINIKFKSSESGPSGGLITTLEIYNQLVKKDITKGKTIAGTGTIEPDGKIGQIGGIEHKILGASSAKADIFLSPDGKNYKDAKKYIKEKKLKIKLIKVKTIEDAIKKLEKLK